MSDETKHTPGTWNVVDGGVDGDEPGRWCVCTNLGGRNFFIAEIQNGAPGDLCATELANARLIAAAPLLLEACEAFVKCGNGGSQRTQAAIDLATVALAAAKAGEGQP